MGGDRKGNGEGGAATGLAVKTQRSMVALDHLINDRQPQPDPLTDLFGRKVGLKNARQQNDSRGDRLPFCRPAADEAYLVARGLVVEEPESGDFCVFLW